jgi:UDP-glucose 4-epimerase
MSCATLVIGGGGFIGAQLCPPDARFPAAVACHRAWPQLRAPRHPIASRGGGVRRRAILVRADSDSTPACCSSGGCAPCLCNGTEDVLRQSARGSARKPAVDRATVFALAAEFGLRLVHVSSGGTVYGEAVAYCRLPKITRTHPISPYGVTKLTLEKYAHLYAVTRGLDVVCLRPANAYGEGQRPFTGQGFIATAMASALRNDPVRHFWYEWCDPGLHPCA